MKNQWFQKFDVTNVQVRWFSRIPPSVQDILGEKSAIKPLKPLQPSLVSQCVAGKAIRTTNETRNQEEHMGVDFIR